MPGQKSSASLFPLPERIFIGRESLLQTVTDALIPGACVAIVGLPGVGKTQLALQAAESFRKTVPVRLFASASDDKTLTDEYIRIARDMNIVPPDSHDTSFILKTLQNWFQTNDDWLILLDNADDPAVFDRVFFPQGRGRTLITSRDEAIATYADTFDADCLTIPDAVTALCRYANKPVPKPGTDTHADALAVAVECLPIALAQAGTYCLEAQLSFAQFLERMRAQPLSVWAWASGVRSKSLRVVAQVFPFALEWVAEKNPAARDILQDTAFLAADDIDVRFFDGMGNDLDAALALLPRLRLVTLRDDRQSFDVHRLTQDILRHTVPDGERRARIETVCARVAAAYPDWTTAQWDSASRWLPHAQICASDALECGADGEEVALIMNQCGYELEKRGDYPRALPLYERALGIWETALGASHPSTATSLNNLAVLYANTGAWDAALPLMERAVSIMTATLGASHPQTIESAQSLAAMYAASGRTPSAPSA